MIFSQNVFFPYSQGVQSWTGALEHASNFGHMSELLLSCFHGAHDFQRHSCYPSVQPSTLWQPKHAKCTVLSAACNIISVSFQALWRENHHFNPGLWIHIVRRTVSWPCCVINVEGWWGQDLSLSHTHTHRTKTCLKTLTKRKMRHWVSLIQVC